MGLEHCPRGRGLVWFELPPASRVRGLRLSCIFSSRRGASREEGVVGLESCQQSHIKNGVRLQCVSLAFCLSHSPHFKHRHFPLAHCETQSLIENKMCLNNMLTAFIIFLGISSVLRNPLWAKVLELMRTEHCGNR